MTQKGKQRKHRGQKRKNKAETLQEERTEHNRQKGVDK
jgi:hypothetical protein